MKKLLPLLFLVFIFSACSDKSTNKTFINANGYTFTGDSLTTFTTMIVEDRKIREIGGDELAEMADGQTIDLGGKTVLPGLIDAHGHVMNLGFQELQVNLAGIETLEATLDTLKNYAEANPDLEWIQGRGWNQTLWLENEFPTAADIDKVISDRPVWLSRVDGHAGWANTEAMELAGISQDTPDTRGGKIIRDESGKATGVFVDAAGRYINEIVPAPTPLENEMALEKALEQMSRMGLTSAHDAGINENEWNLYKDFADQERISTRIYAMIDGAGDTFDKLSKDGPVKSYADDRLALRSVKISADGALGSRGAAMIAPYSDDSGNHGLLFFEQDELNEMVYKTASNGFQTNIHAIGDKANRVVLNAFEYVKDELGDQDLRHRVEHAQIVSLDDIPRFKELDIIASMQPTHATSDKNMAEDRVGPDRIKGGYAWQSYFDQGTVLASGSDFPVEHSNPFFGLYSAVTRMDHEGNPEGGWYPEHRLSRETALKTFTLNAAYAAHQEDVLGSLEEGKWADFIVIDQDYLEIPSSDIWRINVLETWVAGEKVFGE
ncbi:MAG: amidohydrolase [Balneolaceae bacterium]